MGEHTDCALFAHASANSPDSPMSSLRGEMVVADRPPAVSVPEFPPAVATCPHGERFWIYPDGARVSALRDLNYPAKEAGK